MEKSIKLGQEKIIYTLRESRRAKRLRLAIYCDGIFVVTQPSWFPLATVENFLREKSDWILEKLQIINCRPRKRIFHSQSKKKYQENKTRTLELVKNRIDFYNSQYNFSFNNISIRNQKCRWGSCSSKGNLSFNYKIVFLPEKLVDYIVVHELCHLSEFNHSARFWNLVGKSLPDYKVRKRELRLI